MAVDLESNLIRIKWVDHPDTGRPVRLIETEELKREFLEWLEQECSVHDGKLMRVTLSNGTEMVREQCTTCGKPIGTAVKRADVS
ncbi:MAG TPA: hypothetical protein VHN58_13275, partial [Croceicoccus sp.]|nr:hypothetical protein [Croceicoccus sp.]